MSEITINSSLAEIKAALDAQNKAAAEQKQAQERYRQALEVQWSQFLSQHPDYQNTPRNAEALVNYLQNVTEDYVPDAWALHVAHTQAVRANSYEQVPTADNDPWRMDMGKLSRIVNDQPESDEESQRLFSIPMHELRAAYERAAHIESEESDVQPQ